MIGMMDRKICEHLAGNYENTLLIKRISGRLSEIKEMYTIVDKAEMYYPDSIFPSSERR